jgi:hypothetical protein
VLVDVDDTIIEVHGHAKPDRWIEAKDRGALIFAFWVAAREHRDRCARAATNLWLTKGEQSPETDHLRSSRWWQSLGDVFDWDCAELHPLLAQIRIIQPTLAPSATALFDAGKKWTMENEGRSNEPWAAAESDFELAANKYLAKGEVVTMPGATWASAFGRVVTVVTPTKQAPTRAELSG